MPRLALDAMGGDHAPAPIVAGAVQAVTADPELHVTLVGDAQAIEALLGDGPREQLSILHCSQVIGMDESPVQAMRAKPDNTMSRCWQMLARKEVDGIVSAGNTGAMVAAGFFSRRFLKNVKRPGIAALMPTARGPCVIMDVGANPAAESTHLFQYGVMGAIYAKHVLKRDKPSIGLMNIGEEEGKGTSLAKSTAGLFQASPLKEQFLGNIEGRDIHRGKADVVVMDGFTGNVVLKVCEGLVEFVFGAIKQEVIGVLSAEKAQAGQAFKSLVAKYDYAETGGAPLLGIDGICIICHGSSGERAIKNALNVATNLHRANINERIVQELEDYSLPTA